MKFKFAIIVFLIVGYYSAIHAQSLSQYHYMTENYPPFNMKTNDRLEGISVDLLIAIFQKLGINKSQKDIDLLPWARGYKYVQTKPNSVLFAMTRTPARESLFKWAGPIAPTKISVLALKSRNIKIQNRSDLLPYKTGVIQADIGDQIAKEIGIKKIERVSQNKSNIGKLLKKRIDIWIYEESVAKWQIKSFGYNPDDFEVVYTLTKGDLYYAFHISTPSKIISDFQETINKIKTEGAHQKIINKYLK